MTFGQTLKCWDLKEIRKIIYVFDIHTYILIYVYKKYSLFADL